MTARRITLSGLMGALLYVSQVVMSGLPNIHLVAVLLIAYVLVLPREAAGATAVFILLEGFTYGFGIWWLSYLYIWPLFVLAVYLLRKWDHALFWAAVAGAFGLSFGALCAIPYLFAGGPTMAAAYWVSGIPFDLAHGAGNFIGTAILYRPLYRLLSRLKKSLRL